jgi:hypothetical protein
MKCLLMIISVMLLSSCKYGTTFSKLNTLNDLKSEVETVSSQDLTRENQLKLRAYFSSIKDIAYEFMNNSKMQKYTHKKFTKFFNESICSDIVLDQATYVELMNKCTVNGFYICSEEVKSYKGILVSLKKLFNEKEIEMITANESCKSKLKNLGVINE